MQTFLELLNNFSYKLQKKGDIECYDEIMRQHPNYLKIWWYNLISRYKSKGKEGDFRKK
jgi:hypothetical protein